MPNIKPKQKSVPFSKEEMDAASWCLRNGIGISLLSTGKNSRSFYVDIDNKGSRQHNGNKYEYYEAQRLVYDYYMYYYKKYSKK